ncbi:DUF1761 domain-containing protein [Candidatus Saccharibacteria bacterium]|nr:DUF1761 domain-containing protein [Candidatus Saccharibacteria bacterium]
MDVQINWLAVVLATVSSMLVGAIWYAKPVFGKNWQKLVKLDDKKMQKGAAKAMGITVIVSLVTAFVLAHLTYLSYSFYDTSFMSAALTTAFWVWLGFTAARMITHDAFEQRNAKLTVMNVVHELVTILVMGLVIGWLQP